MTAARPKPKRARLETPGQAQTWDAMASRYRATGWCNPCAARAAWGHQLGFTNIDPVGNCCLGRTLPAKAGIRAQRWATTPAEEPTP